MAMVIYISVYTHVIPKLEVPLFSHYSTTQSLLLTGTFSF